MVNSLIACHYPWGLGGKHRLARLRPGYRPRVTAVEVPLTPGRPFPARRKSLGAVLYGLVSTTEHKLIGQMYLAASFAFFFSAGIMALLMRTELAMPGLQFLSN